MITLTRLNASTFALNSDLIERIEATPDTVIVLLDATRYLVKESVDEVVARIRRHRAEVIVLCHGLEPTIDGGPSDDEAQTAMVQRGLRVVTSAQED